MSATATTATGPRTPEGKQRSSMNACKHNLTGGSALLPSEDPEAYAAHCEAQVHQYRPVSEHAKHLVKELADSMWRLDRARGYEVELLASVENPFLPDQDEKFVIQLQRLTRYIAAIERTYYRAYNELKRIDAERESSRWDTYEFHGNNQPKKPVVQNEPPQRAEAASVTTQMPPRRVNPLMQKFENACKTGQLG